MSSDLLDVFTPMPNGLFAFDHFKTLPSTQDFCTHMPPPPLGMWRLAVADHQTQGRGQYQRAWHAPDHTGLWMTLATTSTRSKNNPMALTLCMGLWLANIITPHLNKKAKLTLKWPNDVLINGEKVAGILTECETQGAYNTWIIGIGINLNKADPIFPFEALEPHLKPQSTLNRATLCKAILDIMMQNFPHAMDDPSKHLDAWQALDAYKGKPIIWTDDDAMQTGIGGGIDNEGAYLIHPEESQILAITKGQIRPNN